MAQYPPIPETLRVRRVLPHGVSVLAAVNDNIVANLRKGASADVVLPSLWREAKLVVGETAPLDMYSFDTRRT